MSERESEPIDRSRYGRMYSAALGAFVLLLAACSSSGTKKPSASSATSSAAGGSSSAATATGTVTVPLLIDATGPYAQLQLPAGSGFKTIIADQNDKGGVNGQKIDLKVFDTQSTPTGAAAAAREAIALKPPVMFTAIVSTEMAGLVSLFSQAGVPIINTAASSLVASPPQPWLFAIGPPATEGYQPFMLEMQKLAGGNLTGKKVAIEYYASAAIQTGVPILVKHLQDAGATVTSQQEYAPTQSSFAGPAASMAATKPDYVVLYSGGPDVPVVTAALKTAGYTGPMVLTPVVSAALMVQLAIPNLYAYFPGEPAGTDLQALATKYGQSTAGATFAYGILVGTMVFAGLKKCGPNCTPDKFGPALETAGPITAPYGQANSALTYSATNHLPVPDLQFYNYDAATKALVKDGSPLKYKL